MNTKTRELLITIGIIVLSIVVITGIMHIIRNNNKSGPDSGDVGMKTTTGASPPNSQDIAISDSEAVTTTTSGLQDLAKEIGLKKFSLPVGTAGTMLNVRVSRLARCTSPGDIDAIAADLKHGANQRILFSIEALSGTGQVTAPGATPMPRVLLTKTVTLQDIRTGLSIDSVLDKSDRPVHYGIYLCRDVSGTGRCSDKEFADINDILVRDAVAGMRQPTGQNVAKQRQNRIFPSPPVVADAAQSVKAQSGSVYFFQPLILEKPGSALSLENSMPSEHDMQKLAHYVGYLHDTPNGGDENYQIAMNMHSKMNTIQSLPLNTTKNGIELSLPEFDKTICK